MSPSLRSLSICLLGALSLVRTAVASHNREEYAFDDGLLFGWSSSMLSPQSPFGGDYLGPFPVGGNVSKFVMDALPSGPIEIEYAPRAAVLSMVLVGYAPTESFQVTINSTVHTLGTAGSVVQQDNNALVTLPFHLKAAPSGLTDILIEFQKTAGFQPWGLDNVIIDWSQVVPEPASAALLPWILLKLRRRTARSACSIRAIGD